MLRLSGLLLRRRAPGCAHTCLSRCALLRGSVRVSAPPSPPQRQLGLLTSLRDALGLAGRGTSGHLETPAPGRDEILEARATQASAELRRLLRDGDSTQPAWGYFDELCAGPDANAFHVSIMLRASASPEEADRVVEAASAAGIELNSTVVMCAPPRPHPLTQTPA